jgi:hypothetical protein
MYAWGAELMAENRSWGEAAAKASVPLAAVAGLARGAYDAATGNGTFRAGFEHKKQSVIQAAEKFGREKGDAIEESMISNFLAALKKEAEPRMEEGFKQIGNALKKNMHRRAIR